MLFINVLLMCDVHFWFCTSILWCLPPLLCVGVGGALSFNLKFKFIQVFFKIKFFQGIFLFSFKFFKFFFFFWVFFYVLYVNYVSCLLCAGFAFHMFCKFFPKHCIFQITTFLYDEEKKQVICHYKCLQLWGFDFHSLDIELK